MTTKSEAKDSTEFSILKTWHVKLLLIGAIAMPAVSATGAYYGLREKALADKAEISDRVSKIELESAKTFADKQALQSLDARTQRMENDITEIKTILKAKLR